MRTYDTYKDSDISWLGQIPSHWELYPMKRLFSFGKGLSITKADLVEFGKPVISYGQVHSIDNPGTRVNEKLLRYVPDSCIEGHDNSSVSHGDFIFADTSEDLAGCGNCAYIDRDGIYAGYHSLIAKGHGRDNKYFAYMFLSDKWRYQIRSRVNGIKVYSITKSILSSTMLIVPPLVEQETIVAYLDSATAEIDKAIASQQRMVELLQERKQIIINQAVTKGLNPDAPMKPTNIDWLPQIPAHWELKKIKYVVLLKSGQNLTSEQIEKEDLYPVYGGNGLRGYYSDYNNDGDYVLIGRQGALCGNINYAHNKFWATEHAVVCYPVERVNVLWLGETLRAMNLNRYATASAQPGLAVENIKGLMMPVPDYKEQNDIADYIEKQTKPIDESIESCNRMIGALTERKQILINDVVTGKIKVS